MSNAELSKLIALLRRNGVTSYATQELRLELGAPPGRPMRAAAVDVEPTEEDLAGHPSAFLARFQRERQAAKGKQ